MLIELEADHFASGLLMPTKLVRKTLMNAVVGLDGIMTLANEAQCSLTASAIRAAECSNYPISIIVSEGEKIAYAFMSEGFKKLDKLSFLSKGKPLPDTITKAFNSTPANILNCERTCGETTLDTWFDCTKRVKLDEEVIGLGNYGYTLTVLSSDELSIDPDDEGDDEDDKILKSWDFKFAYGR